MTLQVRGYVLGSLVLLLTGALGCGASNPKGATGSTYGYTSSGKEVKQRKPQFSISARANKKSLVVIVFMETMCLDSDGAWSLCEGKKPMRGSPFKVKVGNVALDYHTEENGEVEIELSRFADNGSYPKEAIITSGNDIEEHVNLENTEFYKDWVDSHDRFEKQQKEVEQKEAEKKAQKQRAQLELSRNMLKDMETSLRGIQPPWTKKKLDEFGRIVGLQKKILTDQFDDSERNRLQLVSERIDKLMPGALKKLDEIDAAQDKQYVANGWKALKTILVAPATASLSSYEVKLRCAKGRIIVYEFDSQNRLGALLRTKGIVKINANGGFNARLEEERVEGFAPFQVLMRDVARQNCAELE